ncbi:MAG: hypothetical protein WCJ46_01210 [bacterium]
MKKETMAINKELIFSKYGAAAFIVLVVGLAINFLFIQVPLLKKVMFIVSVALTVFTLTLPLARNLFIKKISPAQYAVLKGWYFSATLLVVVAVLLIMFLR